MTRFLMPTTTYRVGDKFMYEGEEFTITETSDGQAFRTPYYRLYAILDDGYEEEDIMSELCGPFSWAEVRQEWDDAIASVTRFPEFHYEVRRV